MTEFVPTFTPEDPANRLRAITESIATKRSRAPLADNNGYPLPMEQQSHAYRKHMADVEASNEHND